MKFTAPGCMGNGQFTRRFKINTRLLIQINSPKNYPFSCCCSKPNSITIIAWQLNIYSSRQRTVTRHIVLKAPDVGRSNQRPQKGRVYRGDLTL